MEKYKSYTLHDWIWDEAFRAWVLNPTPELNATWHAWLNDNPDQWAMAQKASAIVRAVVVKEPSLEATEVEAFLGDVFNKMTPKTPVSEEAETPVRPLPRQMPWRLWARVAAMLVVGFGVWFFLQKKSPNTEGGSVAEKAANELIETVNNTDKPQTISLSDGSVVTLKKGSKLRYNAPFSDSARTVYLTGEAFFSIAKDAQRPFRVYANEIVTQVLGTSFNIRAYDADEQVTVEVKTGKVSVFSPKKTVQKGQKEEQSKPAWVLTPNQKMVFDRKVDRMTKTLVDAPAIVLTKQESQKLTFNFDETPADQVLEIFKKAYGINILYDETILRDCPITAPLDGEPLFEKLAIICKAINARYEIIEGQIVIYAKGC